MLNTIPSKKSVIRKKYILTFTNSIILRSFISAISFIISIIIAKYTLQVPAEKYLFLLPLFYGILLTLLPNLWNYKKNNIGMLLLNLIVFVRYVVAPIFRAFSINMPNIRGIIPSISGTQFGLIIMLIELFTTFIVIQIFSKRIYKSQNVRYKLFKPFKSKFILYISLFLSIGILFVFPQIRNRYNFFIVSDVISDVSLNLPLNGLFFLLADLFFIIFPIVMIDYFKRKYDKNELSRYIIFSLFSILPSITFFKGTSRFSVIIPTIAFMVILVKLYPKYSKRLITLIGSTLLVVFISITLYKQFGFTQGEEIDTTLDVNDISYNLDAYMSGPDNMGRVVDLKRVYGSNITSTTLKNDLLNNVAVLSTFSDSQDTTSSWFNYYLYGHTKNSDQIVPLSGQSYLHFGVLGIPVLLIITLFTMMYFDSKIKYESRIEYVYLYVYITIYASMAMMVSFGSIYPIFTNIFFPLLFIFYLNRKIVIKR